MGHYRRVQSRKSILITGIAGFIGFHLALHLKKRGDHVFGYDNFNAYYAPELKEQRAALLKKAGISVERVDLAQKGPSLADATHVVHLAAQAGVRHSIAHPEEYVQANLIAFFNLLETLRRSPQVKLIYASSSSVYGHNRKVPFSESDQTDSPANFYGATKKSNELMATSYHHLYGLSTTGLRFFTVYGPWGRPDMAYYAFTDAIANERPIKVFGEGDFQRDFTYIDDIVKGTAAAIDLGAPH